MTRSVGRLAGTGYPAGTSDRVDDYTVAPHRYTNDAIDARPANDSPKAWRATVPYQSGDVVWVQDGVVAKRALIVGLFSERNRYGDFIAKFRVRLETRAGYWSKLWVYTWPGFIQRGYEMAAVPDPREATKKKSKRENEDYYGRTIAGSWEFNIRIGEAYRDILQKNPQLDSTTRYRLRTILRANARKFFAYRGTRHEIRRLKPTGPYTDHAVMSGSYTHWDSREWLPGDKTPEPGESVVLLFSRQTVEQVKGRVENDLQQAGKPVTII